MHLGLVLFCGLQVCDQTTRDVMFFHKLKVRVLMVFWANLASHIQIPPAHVGFPALCPFSRAQVLKREVISELLSVQPYPRQDLETALSFSSLQAPLCHRSQVTELSLAGFLKTTPPFSLSFYWLSSRYPAENVRCFLPGYQWIQSYCTSWITWMDYLEWDGGGPIPKSEP